MDLRKYHVAVLHGSLCVHEADRFIESTLGLAGESGEFCDLVKKSIRDGSQNTNRLLEELGDVLWYVTSLAGQIGFTLDELASLNYQKLHERHPHIYPDVVE